MTKLLPLLLVCVAHASESPMKPEKPVPAQPTKNIKVEHKEAKKLRHEHVDMRIPGAPKLVYRKLEL